MEEVLARIDLNPIEEQELKGEIALVEQSAHGFAVITSPQEYKEAAEVGKSIKNRMKMVTDFFKPLKDAANKAHKTICARENALLTPLKQAEAALKTAMVHYVNEQERKRREEEEALRRRLREEEERRLAEAARLEAEGKLEEAEAALNEAVSMESLGAVATVESVTPKAAGAAIKKDWIIQIVDASKVPISVAGAVIRPIDEAAIKRLVKATNGGVQIPGVTFRETANIALRR